jgi:large conductance mechanosensitive channel
MFKEFREFALRGNVIDLALAVVIGAAFGAIVQSLVKDVIMPPIGLLAGGADFADLFILLREGATPGPYATLEDAQAAGAVTVNYGSFFNTIVSFIIIAFAMFLVVKAMNRAKRRQQAVPAVPTTKQCPHCRSSIALDASRCAFCTSQLTQQPVA